MLNSTDKDTIANLYNTGMTMEDIGIRFNRSRRTVGRVLREKGLTIPYTLLSSDDKAMLQIIKRRGLTYNQLLFVLRKYDKEGL